MAISEQQIRAVLERHWSASAAGDLDAEHDIYQENAVCEYPQSGERILGRENLKSLRGHHPGRPSGFTVHRITGSGNLWVTEYVINYQGNLVYTVSIMEFEGERCRRETQYFGDPFDAPSWRAQWVEQVGHPIQTAASK
jgi:ketosteroid isomerase-like protein